MSAATASSWRMYHPATLGDFDHGSTAPPASDFRRSGMTRVGSISISTPRPVHFEQAPCGLLKLNVRGSISPMEVPS